MIPLLVIASSLASFQEPSAARAVLDEVPVLSSSLVTEGDIWTRLSLYADGRLRAEHTMDQPNGQDRTRGRMRMRVGGDYEIQEGLKFGARVTTLSDGRDANNPHWDFGDGSDGFSAAEVGLDRLFLSWEATPELSLTGGKFAHTFTRPPVTREFAWDDDVQSAGFAATWAPERGDSVGFDVRFLGVVAGEVNSANDSGSDPAMTGLQANMYLTPAERISVQLASSYSHWSSLESFSEPGAQGNTPAAEGFAIWDTYAALTWSAEDALPVTVYAQYLDNVDDESGEDTGYVAGAQLGHSGGKGRGNVFAAVYSLDANAVFSPVAQDDTPIPGTGSGMGMDGYVAGGQYFISDNLSLKVWALTSDADLDDDPVRLRFDLDFRIR